MPHPLFFFSKLSRNRVQGGAPHKPVLLLAIMELVRKGEILNNRIAITSELILEFRSIWSKLVISSYYKPNFSFPFYHMGTEPFWELVTYPGMTIPTTSSNSIRSLKALKESVAFAELDPQVFALMLDPIQLAVMEKALLEQYFPETKNRFSYQSPIILELENQILLEDAVVYRKRIEVLKETLSKEEFEEEISVRSAVFKREIPKIYNFMCAISEMCIESSTNAQMIDACHIIPFSISENDTTTNGIALSPNLHRAYDRGLITITEDYRVKISPAVRENHSPFSLKQFEGKQILLPENKKQYPSIENLKWHHRECFVAG
jgi:putative restriction endonuclease